MKKQFLPIFISLGLFVIFTIITYFLLRFLNTFNIISEKLSTQLFFSQIGLGIFIYLKTAVDYAIFVGCLMEKNTGTPKRIAMNAGTSIGCFLGVTLITILWSFFKEVHWLMVILLVVSAMILFKLGDGSKEHYDGMPEWLKYPLNLFFQITRPIVKIFTFFMPNSELSSGTLNVGRLFFLSMIIPFALGADDLAGYMVLLTPLNVFSLLIGIYFGDAIIDIGLFSNQKLTVKIVKNKYVSYFGALIFIFLGFMSIFHAINYII